MKTRIGVLAVLALCAAVGLYQAYIKGHPPRPKPSASEPEERIRLTSAEEFLEIVDDPLSTPVQRAQAATALGAMGPPAVPHIKKYLKHPSVAVRRHAVRAACSMQTPLPDLLPELIVLIGDADRATAHYAINAAVLSGPDDPAVAEAVDHAVRHAPEESVRLNALRKLGRLTKPNLNTLRTALVSPQPQMRGAAAEALLEMGEGALPLLPDLIIAPDGGRVVMKLAGSAVDPLEKLAKHTDSRIRRRALAFLATLTTKQVEVQLTRDPYLPPPPRPEPQPEPKALDTVRRLTPEYLKWAEESAEDLEELDKFRSTLGAMAHFDTTCAKLCLDSAKPSVRYVGAIVRFSYEKSDERAVGIVLSGLATADSHWRRACVSVLESRWIPAALPAIKKLLDDPDSETAAAAKRVVKYYEWLAARTPK